jgi:hypothetical protein
MELVKGQKYRVVGQQNSATILSLDETRSIVYYEYANGFLSSLSYGDFKQFFQPFGTDIAEQGCKHERKRYIGFTDTYDYCVKCNERLG